MMFGAASHVAIVLGVSFDLRAGPPAPVFWVLGLAPLIANFLYEWLRRHPTGTEAIGVSWSTAR
jgi:hypothetical protein